MKLGSHLDLGSGWGSDLRLTVIDFCQRSTVDLTPFSRVRDLWEKWDEEKRLLCAPSLLYFEVTNALYRYQRAHMMSASAVRLALNAALSLPIQLYGEASLHSIAIDLAERFSLPAVYDAHYLALAQHLDTEFWSSDKRLIQAVQHALPWVHSVE